MSNADSVSQNTAANFNNYAIGSVTGASLGTAGNAVIAIPFFGGGLTVGNATTNSGQVVLRKITIQNANSNVTAANIAVTISSSGNVAAANVVVANVVLTNLFSVANWQDLTLAYTANTTVNGFATQALFVNVNTAVANGTVDIRVYGDVVSF